MTKPTILALGAGYGCMMAIKTLQKKLRADEAEIILISKHNYHFQTTLLHEVATGTLPGERAKVYVHEALDMKRLTLIEDEVIGFKKEANQVITRNGIYDYDYLIIGLGFSPETFGIEGMDDYAMKISSLDRALMIKEHIEKRFQNYLVSKDTNDLKVIVCGGGLTGVEFASDLANQIKNLCEELNIDASLPEIVCVEAGPNILPMLEQKLIDEAVKRLELLGVRVLTNTFVKACTDHGVIVEVQGEKSEMNAGTVVWTAGVRGHDVIANSEFQNSRGKIAVDDYLRVPGDEHIFVVGDCALVMDPECNRPFPPTAQIASQQGEFVGKVLTRILRNESLGESFVFQNRGVVCSLGYNNGVGVALGFKLKGHNASFIKNTIENKWLLSIGGPTLVMKKGKCKF